MSTLNARELKAAKAFYSEFEPIWMTASWLGEQAFDAGIDKLQQLAIPQENTCEISLVENKLVASGVLLGAPKEPDKEVVGFFVSPKSWRDVSGLGQGVVVGKAFECPSCSGLGATSRSGFCKKCQGSGLQVELTDPPKPISKKIETLEKHFTGLNRFSRQVKETQQWIKDYKPVFYAYDGGVAAAIEVAKQLGISEDHLWSSFYQYVNNELICVVTEFSESPPNDGGSIGLYITKNPGLDWKFIQIEGGFSCMDCGGEDEECELCEGAESTWEEWGPAGLSNDVSTLVKIFGKPKAGSTDETLEQPMKRPKFCPECGEQYINSTQKFCGSCGSRRPGS
jgi:hypothetical protein